MPYKPKRGIIERTAASLGLIPKLDDDDAAHNVTTTGALARYPSPDQWHDVVELDPSEYPRKSLARHYRLVPTTCFNCESACGLLAYVDKDTQTIRKFEGNPAHPGSRGRNCAKGPATINQIKDADRILAPMKRVGPRGSGQWVEVTWDEALADIGGRVRKALQEKRNNEVVYHVGRPGSEGFMDRLLRAWGVDGHNSHTNICSSGARVGYALWCGFDRPSPDYANARFILAMNAHLESGHYFNPHAQRITEGIAAGARMAVIDPRLSNTASMAHHWLPTRPGTEAALLLAFARVILQEGLYDKAYIDRWFNWRAYLDAAGANDESRDRAHQSRDHDDRSRSHDDQSRDRKGVVNAHDDRLHSQPLPHGRGSVQHDQLDAQPTGTNAANAANATTAATIDDFIDALKKLYDRFTPEYAEAECGVPASQIVAVAHEIGAAGSRFCSHTWRGAASGHLGGWQVSRCLFFLHALTGSVGTRGGTGPNGWHKYKAHLINPPPPTDQWNELHWPREYPLAHYEMSFLLPHFLNDGRGKIDTYFTRVFNPVWTYPDGFTWIEALRDESKIGLHVALTPTWNETAFFADYVLPMGHGPERHDLTTYETHSATWIAFRQPVLRAAMRAEGREPADTREANPGQVWEEDEFWIALTWAIDPDGSMGIRKYFESVERPGEKLGVDEYYRHIFDRVPGLPETAKETGETPIDYMRKYGAFEVQQNVYERNERKLTDEQLDGSVTDPRTGVVTKNRAPIGVVIDGVAVEGFHTPSRLLEFHSPLMAEWGWPEHTLPGYIGSHVYESDEHAIEPASHQPATNDPSRDPSNQSSDSNDQSRDRKGAVNAHVDRPHSQPLPHGRGSVHSAAMEHSSTSLGNFPADCPPLPEGRYVLLPTFRLPTLIHSRSGSAKWLNEISQRNPLWIHTSDGRRLGVRTGDLVRITTEIGHFVDRAWVTESIRPGVVACSHHLGRWRRQQDPPNSRWSGSVVAVDELSPGKWRLRTESGPGPFDSDDPDSSRIWWRDGGVAQNLTHAVHADPISGMHCWHQQVTVEKAQRGDRAGDVLVDTAKSMAIYRAWLKRTRWPVGPGNLRRPLSLNRPLRPTDAAYEL